MPSSQKPKNSLLEKSAILDSALLRPCPHACPLPSSALSRRPQCYTYRMKAHVWVMPKRTVLDPQGQTIQHALSGLGYAAVKDVRQGKFFVLNLDGWSREEAQAEVERMAKEVLTNLVIEEYHFEIVD